MLTDGLERSRGGLIIITVNLSIDIHHASPMMKTIAALREKYDLHMKVERFVSEDLGADEQFIRK